MHTKTTNDANNSTCRDKVNDCVFNKTKAIKKAGSHVIASNVKIDVSDPSIIKNVSTGNSAVVKTITAVFLKPFTKAKKTIIIPPVSWGIGKTKDTVIAKTALSGRASNHFVSACTYFLP